MVHEILESGCEVGLHGSYLACESASRLENELATLQFEAPGIEIRHHRFHYLRHRPAESWPILDNIGFTTDSSLGYASIPGPRSGYSFPYRAWDHEKNCPLDILLIPIAAMDTTFLEGRYSGGSMEYASTRFRSTLDRVHAKGGGMAVLWHNNRLVEDHPKGWLDGFESMLGWASEESVWLCTVGELEEHWRSRIRVSRAGGVQE
jgi:hypothetical protein